MGHEQRAWPFLFPAVIGALVDYRCNAAGALAAYGDSAAGTIQTARRNPLL